jgi:IclR family KDG regulon transcriptional repressor
MDVLSLYWLGPQLLYLGGQASARNALIYASSEVMDNLLKDTREGVGLLVRNKLEAVMVAHRDFHDGRKLSRLPHLVPPRGPLHAGGASKVLLAYAPQEIIDEVIARYADSFLPASVRTREGILALLEGIRRDGFYVALGELHPDVFTINGPVRDPYGNVVASLGVMGLMTRLNPEYRQHLVESVLEGAQAISKLLG